MAIPEVSAMHDSARDRATRMLFLILERVDIRGNRIEDVEAFVDMLIEATREPVSAHTRAAEAELVGGRRAGKTALQGRPLDDDGAIELLPPQRPSPFREALERALIDREADGNR